MFEIAYTRFTPERIAMNFFSHPLKMVTPCGCQAVLQMSLLTDSRPR